MYLGAAEAAAQKTAQDGHGHLSDRLLWESVGKSPNGVSIPMEQYLSATEASQPFGRIKGSQQNALRSGKAYSNTSLEYRQAVVEVTAGLALGEVLELEVQGDDFMDRS
jgi:hypothetical protein